MPTGDNITRHQNMNTQKEQHAWKTEHLTQKHGPTQSNETNPKTNHDPAYPEGDEGMSHVCYLFHGIRVFCVRCQNVLQLSRIIFGLVPVDCHRRVRFF